MLVKEGGILQARIVEMKKSFAEGTLVSLANPDIRDVLFTVWNVGRELKSELSRYVQSQALMEQEKNAGI
jgi:hypothetical protein